jgi:outer membrane protein TolC
MIQFNVHSLLLLSLLSWLSGIAQSPPLDRYVDLALVNNLALQRQDLAYEQSQQALREAKGLFFPQVSFIANYTLAAGGRTLDFPVGDLLNPAYATLNQLTESQQFPTNIENVSEQFLPNHFHETKLRLIQPIFNPEIYFNRQAKAEQVRMSEAQRDAYRRELTRDLRVAYFQYLQSHEVMAIYAETGELLRELLRTNRSLVANDKATPEIIAQAEYQLAQWQSDRAAAEQQQRSARAYVNFLLNRPLQTDLERDSTFSSGQQGLADLAALQGEAQQQRPELDQLSYAQAANQQALQLQQWRSLPTVNLVIDAGFQGFGYTFDENQDFILGQVSLNWTLFSGLQRRAQVEQVRLQQQSLGLQSQALSQQINLQVQQAYDQLGQAQQQIEATQRGLRSAQQAFRLVQRQYQEGQANWLALTQARNDLTQAQLQQAIAHYTRLARQAELVFATGQ